MQKFNFKKLWLQELVSIIRSSWKQLIGIGVLMGFLVFILNIFLSLSLFLKVSVVPEFKERLGMFFFVQDIPGNEHMMYQEVMELSEKLEDEGMEVQFLSKQDGLDYMESRLPLISDFEKYGIDNPIPATLYVMFDDEAKYEVLKNTILEHKSIIANIDVLDKGKTLKQQESRNITYLNLTNFFVIASYILVVVIAIIILFFLKFLLEHLFNRFREDLAVKKLLGATSLQVSKSFVCVASFVLLIALGLALVLILVSVGSIHYYVSTLFGVSVLGFISQNLGLFVGVLVGEFVLLASISLVVSYLFVKALNKKV